MQIAFLKMNSQALYCANRAFVQLSRENIDDSHVLDVGAVAVGKEHRYKRYTKSRECGKERKFMTHQKCYIICLRQP